MVAPLLIFLFSFFFFNDTATTEIYTLSLHDALPIAAGRKTPEVWVVPVVPSNHLPFWPSFVVQLPLPSALPISAYNSVCVGILQPVGHGSFSVLTGTVSVPEFQRVPFCGLSQS